MNGSGKTRTEANKRLVRRYIEEVVNAGNVDRIAELVSPDYAEVYRNQLYPMGLDGAREHVLGVRRTYPDLKVTIEQQIAEGEWVASRITARGTHRGEWMGMKPTGRLLEAGAIEVASDPK